MRCRSLVSLRVPAVVVFAVGLLAALPVSAQTSGAAVGTPDHTPWGHPDLQGVWNFNTNTPLERPREMGNRQILTDEEVAEREEQARQTRIDRPPRDGDPGTYNRFWTDQPRVNKRTSMIVDPPDGRLPPRTPEAQRFQQAFEEARRGVDDDAPTPGGWVHEIGPHGLSVRCIVGFNAGPPMTGRSYNANVQVLQTPESVVLVNEMIHSARIIPLDGPPTLPSSIRQRLGDSRGHWDGNTLVVETTNFAGMVSDFANDRPAGSTMRIIERFKLVDGDTLLYRFTVDDPSWFMNPWTAEIDMIRSDQALYEYACHEGNYSVPNILAGTRAAEKAEAEIAKR
jgi:hypothetical protein